MQNFKTIQNDENSEIGFYSGLNGKGKTLTEKIFKDIIIGFVRRSRIYINVVNEAPFAYRERQLNSVIIPTIDEISDALLMEMPVDRKYDKRKDKIDEHLGFIDCWFTKNNQQYVLELKHSFENPFSENITKQTFKEYATGIKQIDSSRRTLKQIEFFQQAKGTIPILLHAITLWSTTWEFNTRSNSELKLTTEQYAKIFHESEKLGADGPNIIGYWSLNYRDQKKCIDTNLQGKTIFYPGVIFLIKTGELIKNR